VAEEHLLDETGFDEADDLPGLLFNSIVVVVNAVKLHVAAEPGDQFVVVVGFVVLPVILVALMADDDAFRSGPVLQQQFGFLQPAAVGGVRGDGTAGPLAGDRRRDMTRPFAGAR